MFPRSSYAKAYGTSVLVRWYIVRAAIFWIPEVICPRFLSFLKGDHSSVDARVPFIMLTRPVGELLRGVKGSSRHVVVDAGDFAVVIRLIMPNPTMLKDWEYLENTSELQDRPPTQVKTR